MIWVDSSITVARQILQRPDVFLDFFCLKLTIKYATNRAFFHYNLIISDLEFLRTRPI